MEHSPHSDSSSYTSSPHSSHRSGTMRRLSEQDLRVAIPRKGVAVSDWEKPNVRSPQWTRFLAKPAPMSPSEIERRFSYVPSAATATRAALVPSGLIDDAVVVGCDAFNLSEAECERQHRNGETIIREAIVLEKLPARSNQGRGRFMDTSMPWNISTSGFGNDDRETAADSPLRPSSAASSISSPRPEPPSRVEWFCFPSGSAELVWRKERPESRIHVFTLFADGSPLRGIVLTYYTAAERIVSDDILQDARLASTPSLENEPMTPNTKKKRHLSRRRLWVPTAICLLSRLAVLPALEAWLEQLGRLLDADSGRPTYIERNGRLLAAAVQLADELPRPVAGVLSLKIAGPLGETIHVREHFAASRGNQLRRLPADRFFATHLARPTGGGGSLWLAALLLGPHTLGTALACVLLERPVLFIAETVSVLTPVAEALLSLIRPLEWSHVYVPLLPKPLLELLDAPQPYILGVQADWLPEDFNNKNVSGSVQGEIHVTPLPPPQSSHGNNSKNSRRPSSATPRLSGARRSNSASSISASAPKTPKLRFFPPRTSSLRSYRKKKLMETPQSSTKANASSVKASPPSVKSNSSFWASTPVAPGAVAFDMENGAYFSPSPHSEEEGPIPRLPDDFAAAVAAAVQELLDASDSALDDAADGSTENSYMRIANAERHLQRTCAEHLQGLISGSDRYVSTVPRRDGGALLRADEFVNSRPDRHNQRRFLRRLVDTQHFWQFLESNHLDATEAEDETGCHQDQLSETTTCHRGFRFLKGRASVRAFTASTSTSSRRSSAPAIVFHKNSISSGAISPPPRKIEDIPHDPPDALCYTAPPPLPQDCRGPPRRRRSSYAFVPYEDRSHEATHDWQSHSVFAADGTTANATRVYRYGTLADLLGISFEDLWAQLEPAAAAANRQENSVSTAAVPSPTPPTPPQPGGRPASIRSTVSIDHDVAAAESTNSPPDSPSNKNIQRALSAPILN